MGKSVNDHRRAAGISRSSKQHHSFFYYGNEKLVFDSRSDACRVEFDETVDTKNRDEQVFATFLDYKKSKTIETFSGEKFEQTPIIRLSLKEIKQRIKDYNRVGKNNAELIKAGQMCKKHFPAHRPRLV